MSTQAKFPYPSAFLWKTGTAGTRTFSKLSEPSARRLLAQDRGEIAAQVSSLRCR